MPFILIRIQCSGFKVGHLFYYEYTCSLIKICIDCFVNGVLQKEYVMKTFSAKIFVFVCILGFSHFSICGIQAQNRCPHLLGKETVKAGVTALAKVSGLTFFGAIMGGNIASEMIKTTYLKEVSPEQITRIQEALLLEKIAHGALVGAVAGFIVSSHSLAIVADAAWQDTKSAGSILKRWCTF